MIVQQILYLCARGAWTAGYRMYAEHAQSLPDIKLPCGGTAYFDHDSGISYRCYNCNAVVGSIGMPKSCKDEADKWEVQKILGGRGWDHFQEGNSDA